MIKVILGMIIGAVLAMIFVLSWTDSRTLEGTLTEAPSESRVTAEVTNSAPVRSESLSGVAPGPSRGLPNLSELSERVQEAKRELELAEAELERALEGPPEIPISLPPEFDWLSEEVSENHELIQRELVDPAWSAEARAHIENMFSDRPELFEQFGYPTIHCRTTRCEAAFVLYDVNDKDATAAASTEGLTTEFFTALRFRTTIGQNASQPLIDQFSPIGPDDLDVNVEDGVTTILWHLSKR